jgi:hypothetical protein
MNWLAEQKVCYVNTLRMTISMLSTHNVVNIVTIFLTGSGITTYSLNPGLIYTEILKSVYSDFVYDIMSYPYSLISKTTWEGAQTTVCCAVDSKLAHDTGKYYE